MAWMVRDLVDDHVTWDEEVRPATLIGYVASPGSLPTIVACHANGVVERRASDDLRFCLNEVVSLDHRLHLTRRSVVTLDTQQLADLQETGELRLGDVLVRLFVEIELTTSV